MFLYLFLVEDDNHDYIFYYRIYSLKRRPRISTAVFNRVINAAVFNRVINAAVFNRVKTVFNLVMMNNN